MSFLSHTQRSLLEKTVRQGRVLVEQAVRIVLERLAVSAANAPDYLTAEEKNDRVRLRRHARLLGSSLEGKFQPTDRLLDELAYHHWHRMLFARFLLENNLLVYTHEGCSHPVSWETCKELARELGEPDAWTLAGKLASDMLPQIFKADDLEVNLPPDKQKALEDLVLQLPPDIFRTADALGWVYQFWQTDRKEAVNKSQKPIGPGELSPVTQLFTEPYMVQFLLDNSLGAWFALRRLAEEDWRAAASEEELRSKAAAPGLPLTYLRFIRKEDGMWEPMNGKLEGWGKEIGELRIMDPCCGSGHFLAAALHMIASMRIVLNGEPGALAIDRTLEENIHGLELDQRCVEIAAFALAFAAWTFPQAPGFRPLPEFHLACCGQKPPVDEQSWMQLVDRMAVSAFGDSGLLMDTGRDASLMHFNVSRTMRELYQLFEQADWLGSLLDPKIMERDLFHEDFDYVAELLQTVLNRTYSEEGRETAIRAKSMAGAAEMLGKQYDLVITNVPYLAAGKQERVLSEWCAKHYPEARADLATVFLERCLKWASRGGGMACIVLPQNWLFLKSYKRFRQKLLQHYAWNSIAKLGEGGFNSSAAAGAFVVLISISIPHEGKASLKEQLLRGLDASPGKKATDKDAMLQSLPIQNVLQQTQLDNPDSRVTMEVMGNLPLLEVSAKAVVGLQSGDDPYFIQMFWEHDCLEKTTWEWLQNTPETYTMFSGMNGIVRWEEGKGELLSTKSARPTQGLQALNKSCIAIHRMRLIQPYYYAKQRFHQNSAVLIPHDESLLIPIWCYCESPDYTANVRKIDQKLNVTNATLVKVPFDLERWQEVAEEKYPHGLPLPFSDDPTQWIFHGHPCDSVIWDEVSKRTAFGPKRYDTAVLHVAIARLLGYRWPAEHDETMELCEESREVIKRVRLLAPFSDHDGIVPIPAMVGELPAAERLYNLLQAAYGEEWTGETVRTLIAATGSKAMTLEDWLRDSFFIQHCKLFRDRPFLWHVWDGLKDGFSVIVNYHKLDNRLLQSLIYTYLGNWMDQQKAEKARGVDGAEEKLEAAVRLKERLELILEGEAPYDIFVRWKPLNRQPVGWNPDLNDGVRLNIRPWLSVDTVGKKGAGALRDKPNIKWDKDRGKDVPAAPWFDLHQGDRVNDCHLTLEEKRNSLSD